MKIVLATCGSRGDVQPMIATSLALKTALFSKAIKQNAKTAGRQINKTRSLKLIVKAVEQSCL
jgi:UDP:flavonoid glycosyltransferase YjiC (YdhE family)